MLARIGRWCFDHRRAVTQMAGHPSATWRVGWAGGSSAATSPGCTPGYYLGRKIASDDAARVLEIIGRPDMAAVLGPE